jgi:hypothetical protein
MGDRTMWTDVCPSCGAEVDYYDAPSSLMYGAVCDNCGWCEPLDYWEIGKHEIVLCTKEEYCKRYKHTEFCQEERKYWADKLRSERIKNHIMGRGYER